MLAERSPFRRQLTAAIVERQEQIEADRAEAIGRAVATYVAKVFS